MDGPTTISSNQLPRTHFLTRIFRFFKDLLSKTARRAWKKPVILAPKPKHTLYAFFPFQLCPERAPTVPSENFRFLDLPPELRNIVYDHYYATATYHSSPINLNTAKAKQPSRALTRVSRQLHNEYSAYHRDAIATYWRENTFSLDMLAPWPRDMVGESLPSHTTWSGISLPSRQFDRIRHFVVENIAMRTSLSSTAAGRVYCTVDPKSGRANVSYDLVDENGITSWQSGWHGPHANDMQGYLMELWERHGRLSRREAEGRRMRETYKEVRMVGGVS